MKQNQDCHLFDHNLCDPQQKVPHYPCYMLLVWYTCKYHSRINSKPLQVKWFWNVTLLLLLQGWNFVESYESPFGFSWVEFARCLKLDSLVVSLCETSDSLRESYWTLVDSFAGVFARVDSRTLAKIPTLKLVVTCS